MSDPVASSGERFAEVGNLRICYEELGDPGGEPMLLVMGLGTQMIHWQDEFCALLGAEGYRVIRYDNRDVGRSSRIDAGRPATVAMLLGLRRGLAYTLSDMAADAAGLLEALGIDDAHVVGASMGGMIAQAVAYEHPRRVRSLGLIMTGSGKRIASIPRLRALGTLLSRPPRSREGFAAMVVRTFEVIGSPGFETDTERMHELAERAWDRGHSAAGVARQLHAITAAHDRTARLREVRAPTVVIHGTDDPLVRPVAGRAVADAIPGARWVPVQGMGHDLPRGVWPVVAGELVANARRAATPVAARSAA